MKPIKLLHEMFGYMPRQVCTPYRKMVLSFDDLILDMKRLNGRCNLYTSVQSFPGQTEMLGMKYSNCLVNLIPLDFDGMDVGVSAAISSHESLIDENIKHLITWSGGGSHCWVFTQPYKPKYAISCIAGAQDYIGNLGGYYTDPPTRGRPDQIFRLPYTKNIKRGLYCTPVNDPLKMLSMREKDLHYIAGKPELNPIIHDGDLLDLSQFDDDSRQPNILDLTKYIDDTSYNPTIKDVKYDRACINSFIKEGRIGNTKRYWFFMHLKDKNLRVEEAIHIARQKLHGQELEHAIQ